MLYKIIFFDNDKVKYATSILHCVKLVNEHITKNKMMSFPVSKYIIANWVSRKVPLKSTRYDWVDIQKIRNPKTFSPNIS